jgi:hypothetical protein
MELSSIVLRISGVWKNVHTLVIINLVLLSWRSGSKVEGHGRMIDPPSRATMWRYGFDSPANYDDNQGYCGGKEVRQIFKHLSSSSSIFMFRKESE